MRDTIQTVVQQAWTQFQAQMVDVLPRLMATLLVLVIGAVLALVVGRVASWLLNVFHLDRRVQRLGIVAVLETVGITSAGAALARLAQGAIVFATMILALYSIDARLASDLAERFLLYLPHVIVGVVILIAGAMLAKFLARSVIIAAVNAEIQGARLLGGLTRAGVIAVAVAVAFEHLGIGRTTLLTAFAILFGGVTLAAAIAVGVGTQDLVRKWLSDYLRPPSHGDPEQPINHW
jgi:hypothetical protein